MPEEQSKKKEKMTESFQEKQTVSLNDIAFMIDVFFYLLCNYISCYFVLQGFNQPSYEARFKEIESHMQEIKVDIGEIKSNQEIIIGEFSGFEKKMVEYLRTLEKIAVSVENPVKDTSPPTGEVHTEKVASYFTTYVTLQILLHYRLWDFTVYISIKFMFFNLML